MAKSENLAAPHRSKRIVLLSDGTGNSAAKIFRTNVWRFYQALDASDFQQIALYDDGVGTSNFRPLAIIGGAAGWGLKRNLMDLYTFLCRNYRDGDNIYLVGFSRGAFTVRVLAKFILSQGIVSEYYSEDDLRWKARSLYRDFRRHQSRKFGLAAAGRIVRDFVLKGIQRLGISRASQIEIHAERPTIRFLAAWDTVDAYGLPVHELKQGIDRFIWPLSLEDRELDPAICKACHALCMDDQRRTFHPILWDESDVEKYPPKMNTDDERLTQVFFAGAHSNVGGGYPDDSLSYVSLNWMLKEASKAGLTFNETLIAQYNAAATPFGKLYNSRAGLGAFYRYEPRDLSPPRDAQGSVIPNPKIHESVMSRIALGPDAYAPLGLYAPCRVVFEANWPPNPQIDGGFENIVEFEGYAKSIGADKPAAESDAKTKLAGLNNLKLPDRQSVDLIWDTVWWRRIAYFAVLIFAGGLVLTPLLPPSIVTGEVFAGWIEVVGGAFGMPHLGSIAHFLLAPLAGVIALFLPLIVPGFASPWIKSFSDNSFYVCGLIAALSCSYAWGASLERRIKDRSLAAWNSEWSERRSRWFSDSLSQRLKIAIVGSLTCFLLAAHVAWLWYSDTTVEGCKDAFLGALWCPLIESFLDKIRLIGMMALLFLGILLAGSAVALQRLSAQDNPRRRELPSYALYAARLLRQSRILAGISRVTSLHLVPAGFALMLIGATIVAANRIVFLGGKEILDADCPHEQRKEIIISFGEENTFLLNYSQGCLATGIQLAHGTYRFDIDVNERDGRIVTDNDKRAQERVARAVDISRNKDHASDLAELMVRPFLRAPHLPQYLPMARFSSGRELKVGEEFRVDVTTSQGELFFYVNDVVIGFGTALYGFQRKEGSVRIVLTRTQS